MGSRCYDRDGDAAGARADFALAYGSYSSPKHPSSMAAAWEIFKHTISDHETAIKLRVAVVKCMADNAGSEYAYSFLTFLRDQWEGVYYAGRMLEEREDGWAEVLSGSAARNQDPLEGRRRLLADVEVPENRLHPEPLLQRRRRQGTVVFLRGLSSVPRAL